MNRAPSDHELMEAIRLGKAEALAALVDRHGGSMLALCRRIVRDAAEADEVFEEVFWQVWARSEQYDPLRGTPLAYLILLTRSRSLDRVRALRRRGARVLGVGGLSELERIRQAGEPDPSPHDALVVAEERVRVRRALALLTAAQRLAVELSFFEGLTHTEIAQRLDLPLGTVKTRIRRALLVLRKHLTATSGREEVA